MLVIRKLTYLQETCVIHDCIHYLHFWKNPTAKSLTEQEGNITRTITQSTDDLCNEPEQKFKGLKCFDKTKTLT